MHGTQINVCFKKIWTNYSTVSLLWFVQVFLKQTLLFYINMSRVIDERKGLFGRNFSQASAYIFQVYQEFQIQLTDLTVENLLEQFTLAKHTGLEKPGKFV